MAGYLQASVVTCEQRGGAQGVRYLCRAEQRARRTRPRTRRSRRSLPQHTTH